MSKRLSGKTALVTGAAKRLGRAIALALASEGANVVLHYHQSLAEAKQLAEKIQPLGVQAWTLPADLDREEEIEALIERIGQLAGRPQILINSASFYREDRFATFTWDDLQRNLRTNAWAPLVLARRFVQMTGSGHIVNLLDTCIAGLDSSHSAYLASKRMLALFTQMMALEFAPNFSVNAVAPGAILPPEGKGPEYLDSLKNRAPLKRIGALKDVTDAVLFLVTGNYITGQFLFVDGGQHLKGADHG